VAGPYASVIDSKIVLIDGETLTQLMIDYNIGVKPVASHELKRIDSDYFTDLNLAQISGPMLVTS
jgi:restriction system protein